MKNLDWFFELNAITNLSTPFTGIRKWKTHYGFCNGILEAQQNLRSLLGLEGIFLDQETETVEFPLKIEGCCSPCNVFN